jgi:hypothetical protein
MSSEDATEDPHRKLRAFIACSFVLLTSVGLAACPGSLDTKEFPTAAASTGTGSGDCGDVPTTLLKTTCAIPGCHGSSSPQANLDLTADSGLVMRLVDVDSTSGTLPGHVTPPCTGKLIDKTTPEQSLLYTKCTAMPPPCGATMPNTGVVLSDAQKQCLLTWIKSVDM